MIPLCRSHRLHYLVCPLVLEDAVLVDAGFVRERVRAHDRLVRLDYHAGKVADHPRRLVYLFRVDVRLTRRRNLFSSLSTSRLLQVKHCPHVLRCHSRSTQLCVRRRILRQANSPLKARGRCGSGRELHFADVWHILHYALDKPGDTQRVSCIRQYPGC